MFASTAWLAHSQAFRLGLFQIRGNKMEKESRRPLLSFVCGVAVLIALMAPLLALIPFVTGIVLLINKQLLFKAWYRLELERPTSLLLPARWLNFSISKIVSVTFFLTVAQIVMAVLSVTPGLRPDQQDAYAIVFYGFIVVELAIIVLVPIGHVALRWSRIDTDGRIGALAIGFGIVGIVLLYLMATPLLISASLLMIGFCILFLGVNSDGAPMPRELMTLVILAIAVFGVSFVATGVVATALTVANLTGTFAFAVFGGFFLFRSRVLGQEKITIR